MAHQIYGSMQQQGQPWLVMLIKLTNNIGLFWFVIFLLYIEDCLLSLQIRIDQLAEEVLMAKENYQRSLQATADEEVKRQRRQLKPKGELTSKLSPNRNRRKKQRKQGAVE